MTLNITNWSPVYYYYMGERLVRTEYAQLDVNTILGFEGYSLRDFSLAENINGQLYNIDDNTMLDIQSPRIFVPLERRHYG